MSFVVIIDCKFAVDCGVVAIGTIFEEMDVGVAERVSTRVVDACKEYVFAVNSER